MSRTKAYRNLLTQSAINFRELVASQNVYIFFGKDTPWTDENDPPEPSACNICEKSTRANFIYFRKLALEDTALATDRHSWTYGDKYDQYAADDPDLYKKKFFIVTTAGNVYKCLSNNNGAVSTVVPTGTPTEVLITADGYQWKFMYNISVAVAEKFTAAKYLAIPTGPQKTTTQQLIETSATDTSTSPVGGHGKNAVNELFARAFMCNKTIVLQDSSMPIISHRQVGIIVNPTLVNGTVATADEYFLSNNEIDRNSGMLISKNNHTVVSGTVDSAETIQLILEF